MNRKRINAAQRQLIEIELRRKAGGRAIAALAVFGLVGAMALGSVTFSGEDAALHTESYQFEAPASLEEAFRNESIAAAPTAQAQS